MVVLVLRVFCCFVVFLLVGLGGLGDCLVV